MQGISEHHALQIHSDSFRSLLFVYLTSSIFFDYCQIQKSLRFGKRGFEALSVLHSLQNKSLINYTVDVQDRFTVAMINQIQYYLIQWRCQRVGR